MISVFFAPADSSGANFTTRMPGTDWHLYGDTRWPSLVAWVEFPLTHHSRLNWGRFSLFAVIFEENTETLKY